MVAEWLREALDPADEQAQPPMTGRGQEQTAPRHQDTAHFREPARRVGDVLDDLAGPHHIKRAVGERERAVDRHELELQRGVAPAGSGQRRLRDVGGGHPRSGPGEVGREIARAAAEIQDPFPRGHAGQREPPSRAEIGRIELRRQALPQLVVVLLHHVNVPGRGLDTRGAARVQCRAGNTEVQLMPTATVSESDPVTSAPPLTGDSRGARRLLAVTHPGDPEALAAVLEVLRDRDRMGTAARERARRFGSDRYAEQVERLLLA